MERSFGQPDKIRDLANFTLFLASDLCRSLLMYLVLVVWSTISLSENVPQVESTSGSGTFIRRRGVLC